MQTFIAYDFNLRYGLRDQFAWVREQVASKINLSYASDVEGRSQGEIWEQLVRPELAKADRVIAYVDQPNANVGFEIGYALSGSKERRVSLARVSDPLPEWLKEPPFRGFHCPRIADEQSLLELVRKEDWVTPPRLPNLGNRVLLLCPPRPAYLEPAQRALSATVLHVTGWNLTDLPSLLDGVGTAIWVLAPHTQGEQHRDGIANVTASVIAGFVAGMGLPVHVYIHTEARVVVDVVRGAKSFASAKQLGDMLTREAAAILRAVTPITAVVARQAAPRRPHVPPLPTSYTDFPLESFVGREQLIGDLTDALRGLQQRQHGTQPRGAARIQLVWAHGLGGMGKTWLLRRLLRLGYADFSNTRAAYIDWDSTVSRQPLTAAPDSVEHLLTVIAYRVMQLYGAGAADEFWEAKERVDRTQAERRGLWASFRAEVDAENRGEGSVSVQRALRDYAPVHGSADEPEHGLSALRIDDERRRLELKRWYNLGGGGKHFVTDGEAVFEPDSLLASAMQKVLRDAAQQQPLLLALDTCELLSPNLERVLRWILVPLLDDSCALLVVMASRTPPDAVEGPGARNGWRAEVPAERMRIIAFGENERFTPSEIQRAIAALQPSIHDTEILTDRVYSATLGVPLALGMLLDMHRDGSEVLRQFSDPKLAARQADTEVDMVIAAVADRFVQYLLHRPDRQRDFEDIVVLALLPQMERDLLDLYWGGENARRQRLRHLSQRYSLLSSGDLHGTVRHFLQKKWRSQERPACIPVLCAQLLERVAQLIQGNGGESVVDEPGARLRLLRLQLQSWCLNTTEFLRFFASEAAVTMMFGDADAVMALGGSLSSQDRDSASAMQVLRDATTLDGEVTKQSLQIANRLTEWLTQKETCGNWTTTQSAGLRLLRAAVVHAEHERMSAKAACDVISAWEAFEVRPAFGQFGSMLRKTCKTLIEQEQFDDAESLLGRLLALSDDRAEQAATLAVHGDLQSARGNAEAAEEMYRLAQKSQPQDAYYAWLVGRLLEPMPDRVPDAKEAYEQALAVDEKYAAAMLGLGRIYQRQKQFDLAEQQYLRATRAQPNWVAGWLRLGNLLRDHTQRAAEAEPLYCKALEIKPEQPTVLNDLARLYRKLKRTADAEAYFRRAAQADENKILHLWDLADLLRDETDRFEEAERLYQQALELEPEHPTVLNDLACLYRKQHRPESAEQYFRRAAKADSGNELHLWELGDLLRDHTQRFEDAEAAYLGALRLAPDQPNILRDLATLYVRHGDFDRAELQLSRATQVATSRAYPFFWELGNLLRDHTERFDDAKRAYEHALAEQPERAAIHSDLANLYKKHRQPESAEACLRRAVAAAPDQARYARERADLLCSWCLDLNAGRELFETALRLSETADGLDGLAWLHAMRNELAVAEGYLLRAHHLEPGNGDALYNVAYLHCLRGNFNAARVHATRASSIDGAEDYAGRYLRYLLELLCGNTRAASAMLADIVDSAPSSELSVLEQAWCLRAHPALFDRHEAAARRFLASHLSFDDNARGARVLLCEILLRKGTSEQQLRAAFEELFQRPAAHPFLMAELCAYALRSGKRALLQLTMQGKPWLASWLRASEVHGSATLPAHDGQVAFCMRALAFSDAVARAAND